MPPRFSRWKSKLVCAYARHFPLQRGKWRLLKWASPFLVVQLEPGVFIRASDIDNPIEKNLVMKGTLEEEDLRLFLSLISPGMTVMDLGANVGMYTMLAARRVGSAGRVHAFEPTPAVCEKLRQNVELNGLSNVCVSQVAVSDVRGVATFFMGDDSDQNSLSNTTGAAIEVQTITLDDYLAAENVGDVSLMKIDIEGAEVKALEGARRLLSSERAPLLMIEFNPDALRAAGTSEIALKGLLEGHGYACHKLRAYGNDRYWNVLASKPWHHQQFPVLSTSQFSHS
jgi:FkbM family methyltransferase